MAGKKSFLLRIDPKLYDAMEAWAADELRSVNSHIEYLLRDALKKAGRLPRAERGEKPAPGGAGGGKSSILEGEPDHGK